MTSLGITGPVGGVEGQPSHAFGRRIRRKLRLLLWERAGSKQPPLTNFIPNSNGEGGKVIASGHP